MSNQDFPEKDQDCSEKPVDFSDLGPLFASDADDKSTQENTSAVSEEEETLFPEEEEESVSFEPDGAVDFSDLGPLFASEDAPVVAGQAAQVLRRLQKEMEPQQEVPQEMPELVSPDEEVMPDSEASNEDALPAEDLPVEDEAEAPLLPEESSEQEADSDDLPPENDNDNISPEAEEQEPCDEAPASEEISQTQETPSEEDEAVPAFKRPARKGRPKRKKGEGLLGIPNLLVTIVWIAITVLIGVTLGRMAWACASDVLAFGREDQPVTITVYEADTIEDITRKLHEGGLIKYPGLFKFYASLAVDEGEIHPGIWDLNTRYDYHALVNMMSPSSSREVIELMIPEGYSCRQIFALMEENKICTSLDLGAYAASGELDDYWFLDGVPRGDMYCLEGYLFPDTYQFYKNDSPRNVLTKMLNNFESRFDETMIAQIDSLNAHLTDLMIKGGHGEKFIAENQLDIQDVVNVASLIEKETSSADEGYVIASVIYNRLYNWPDNVPYLNIDATIVYALGGKNKLTQEDLKVNSPYNTYTHTGLTPGPIANPGLSSIRAALDPADSNYYYYVLDPALGSHRFSTTYDEHKANIASIGG